MSSSHLIESRPQNGLDTATAGAPKAPGAVLILAIFVINSAAFWLAEMLTAVSPLTAEPATMLAAALGLHLVVGSIAGVVWLGISKLLPTAMRSWSIFDARVVAFGPGALLVVTLVAKTVLQQPATGWTLLAVLVAVVVVSTISQRGPARLGAYTATALAVWLVALRFKAEAEVLEARSRLGTLPFRLFVLIASAALLWALVVALGPRLGRWRSAGVGLATLGFVGVAAGRLLAPAPFEPTLDGDGGLRGRGTPVIVIVLDTVRADHLSVYGYPRSTTPELERFAADAVVHEHAVAPSSWTLPSHASLFTGLFPLGHGALRLPGLVNDANELADQGIHRPAYPLPPSVPTLAEWFQGWRYDTAAFLSNFAYLDPAFGVHRGFDTYFNVRNTPVNPRILRVIHRRVRPLPEADRQWRVYRGADQINDLALRWIESRETPRFFLVLNYMEAHLPWGPHPPGLRYEQFAAEPSLPDRPWGTPAPAERWKRRVDLYDSNIASLDQELGQLFDRLRALDLYDRSLIVVTSDHGESFGENGVDGHGMSLNEAEIRIPLLIKYPGSQPTGRDQEIVQLVDLWPTIAQALGQEIPEGLDGDPIGAIDHPILAEMYTDPRVDEEYRGYRSALYDGGHKLTARPNGEVHFFAGPTLEQPAKRPPDLADWIAERAASLLERHRLLEPDAQRRQVDAEIDPEVEAGLKALGYL